MNSTNIENYSNNSNNLIIPYCIYHKDVPLGEKTKGVGDSISYLSHIGYNELTVDNNGENLSYKCMNKSTIYNSWSLYGTFYSLNPLFRPIPKDMILIGSKWNIAEPYNSISVFHVMDSYSIITDINKLNQEYIYFYAYSRKVKNSVPLYFHKNSEGIYASFDKEFPDKSINWIQPMIPVVYVISPDTIYSADKKILVDDINHLRFTNLDNTCIPDNNGSFSNIEDCILQTKSNKNLSLLQMIKNDNIHTSYFSNYISTIPKYFIIISTAIIMLFVLLYINKVYKNKINKV